MHLSREEIQQKITLINSKPKQFSEQQRQQLKSLNQELTELKNHLKELEENPDSEPKFSLTAEDEQEISEIVENEYLEEEEEQNLRKTWLISKRINELNKQINSIVIQIYNPKTDGKLLENWQRILNPKPLTPEQQAEIKAQEEEEKETHQEEIINELYWGTKYQSQKKDEEELIDWEEYEKTLDKNRTQLIIKPNTYKFKNNKLDLNNYPNLKTIYAVGLNLFGISLSDMPKLQSLNLSNNVLREVVGLENLTSLTSLVLNKNFLKSFNFRKNINLKVLSLATNTFSKIKSLDVRGLKNLEYLDCSFNNLEELKSEDCEKLKTLDADGNSFKNLDFPYLPNLENLSLLSNDYGNPESKNLTLNSPNLKYLVTRNSNIKEIVHKLGLNNELKLISNQTQREIYKDLSTEELIQAWEREVDKTIANSNLDENIRNMFGDTHIDHEEQKKTNREQSRKNPEKIPLCAYPLPTPKENVKEINLPHKNLTGKLIIADYPNLTFINVGNNDLQVLVIRNCPKLARLIYAHNDLVAPEADISECPNLTKENIHNEKCQGGWARPDLTEDEKKKWEEQLNEEWEKGDKDKNSDLDKQLQEVRIQQFIKDLLVLIADIEKDANRGDLNSVQEKIAKIKEYVLLYPGWVDQEINERINKLEKRLQTMIITGPSNKNLITNSIILFIFLIILIYLLIIRWGINKIKTSKNY